MSQVNDESVLNVIIQFTYPTNMKQDNERTVEGQPLAIPRGHSTKHSIVFYSSRPMFILISSTYSNQQ